MGVPITFSDSLRGWVKVLRIPFHSVVVLPFLLGGVLAFRHTGTIEWPLLILSTLAMVCILEMTFLLNEYCDYETDCVNRGFNKFTGGSRALPEGMVNRRSVLKAACWFLVLALAIGLVIAIHFQRGLLIVLLGLLSILTGYMYTAPPIQLAYRGLGEVVIAVSCGWLPVFVSYYLLAGARGSGLAHYAGIPIGAAAFLLILINEVPDYASDKTSGKRTLVVMMGRERAAALYVLMGALLIASLAWLRTSFFTLPGSLALLVPMAVALANLISITRGGSRNPATLEGLCGRTIILSLLTSGALIVAALM